MQGIGETVSGFTKNAGNHPFAGISVNTGKN
jgi:hypothetical protein